MSYITVLDTLTSVSLNQNIIGTPLIVANYMEQIECTASAPLSNTTGTSCALSFDFLLSDGVTWLLDCWAPTLLESGTQNSTPNSIGRGFTGSATLDPTWAIKIKGIRSNVFFGPIGDKLTVEIRAIQK